MQRLRPDDLALRDWRPRSQVRTRVTAVPRPWWFGGSQHPSFGQLTGALEALVAATPGTSFIGAHVGCYAENLAEVSRMLAACPNWNIDTGELPARVPVLRDRRRGLRLRPRLRRRHRRGTASGTLGYQCGRAATRAAA